MTQNNNSTLTGLAAIECAERTGASINKHADPTEGAREGLSIDDAREIAREDASLLWVRVTASTPLCAVELDRDVEPAGTLVTFRVSRGDKTVELSEWLRADGTVEREDSNMRIWDSEAATIVAPPHASLAGPDYAAIFDAMDRALEAEAEIRVSDEWHSGAA